MSKLFKYRLAFYIIGTLIFAFGISLTIEVSQLGVQSWNVLNIGLMNKIGFSIGAWSTIVGLLFIFIVFLLDKSYLSWGTLINVLAVGPLFDLFINLIPYNNEISVINDWAMFLIGALFTGIGAGMYGAVKFGTGPRDSLFIVLSKKYKWDLSLVRIIFETAALLVGISLGGPIFIGTILLIFIVSYIFKYVFNKSEKFLFEKIKNS